MTQAARLTQQAARLTQQAARLTQQAARLTQRAPRLTQRAPRLTQKAPRLTQWAPRLTQRAARRKKTLLSAAMLAACAALAATFVPGVSMSPLRAAASAFLGTYARPDGRVVRLDQGGDTVSEGQAYGMLIAEVTGEDGQFWRIWDWTRHHLQLENGLFAFHANRAGKVVSTEPASDADLLIAWALLRHRGPGAALARREGRRVADAILAHEVARGPDGVPVLTAGPWATGSAGSPSILDPSYWSLSALQGIARLDGREAWHRMAEGAVSIVGQLSHGGRLLPPNWAELSPGGAVQPVSSPAGGQPQPQYGLDAQRTVVWFAASCDPRARALASRWWPLLRHQRQSRALALALDGTIVDATSVGLALVASAAAAKAAGHHTATSRLLRQAVTLQQSYPTYYGGAWAALGRALLTSRTLRAC